ncbi:MAG: hypothetical protein WBF42_14360 [Terracidiphilus sp.]
MRKWNRVLGLILIAAATAAAGSKLKGSGTLKDLQPAGTTDAKDHKNQQYDLIFVAAANQYVCRTEEKTKLRATDFVVGSAISYEIDKDKVKLKSSSGKETKCIVVRVEAGRIGF